MNCSNLEFKSKTASLQTVIDHLYNCSNSFDPPLHTYVNIEFYSNKIIENAITFEAWENDLLIGLVAAYFNDFENKTGFITNVSVLSQYHGKGIAQKMLFGALEYGRLLGFIKVKLEVNSRNKPALTLYSRNGFSLSERKGDKLLLEKILRDE